MSKKQPDPREVELKFDVTEDQMRRLRNKPILRRLGEGRPARATLRSVYFDTPDQSLRARGMSLRVRRKGDSWVQTAKIGQGVVAGMSRPLEIEFPVDGPALDLERLNKAGVPEALNALLNDVELVPLFETVISRTTRQLRAPGGSMVEIAFDSGTVRAGKATSPIREIELELKDGEPSSLFGIAEKLTGNETVRFSEWSKAERGYRLLSGDIGTVAKPKTFGAPALAKDSSVKEAFGPQLRVCAQQIAHNWRVVLDDDHIEGPHQLRVGLRRLRSLLNAYRPVANGDELRQLAATARGLATTAGALRDADVLLDEIVAGAAKAAGKDSGLDELQALLRDRRAKTREQVRAKLSGDEVMGLLLKLGEFIETPKTQIPRKKDRNRPVSDIAGTALEKSWHGAARRGKRIAKLSIDERHEMRKALKKLRYQVDAFGSLYPAGSVKPFRKKLKELQDVFGYLNDVAMADALAHAKFPEANDPAGVQHATGFVLGWHTARAEQAWHDARRTWKSLSREQPFWR